MTDYALSGGLPASQPTWDLGDQVPLVPMARWGKDHWTTFLYVETRWVDHRGMLDHDRMRCDRRRHPAFYSAKRRITAFGTDADGGRYPTRLKTEQPGDDGQWGTVDLAGHDDYDCLHDLVRSGLVEAVMPELRKPHGDIFLTALGQPALVPGGEVIDGSALLTGLTESWLMTSASYNITAAGQETARELRAHVAVTRRSHQFVPSCLATASSR